MTDSGWLLLAAIGIAAVVLLGRRRPAALGASVPDMYGGQRLGLAGTASRPEALVTYQNTEEWEIERNPDGRINKVTIHRKVEER